MLFDFPSRYWCTIGLRRVFSLGEWSPQLPIRFHVSDGTWDPPRVLCSVAYWTVTIYGRPFQAVPLPRHIPHWSPATPACLAADRFRLFPVRSPLLGESRLISIPQDTEMFQFSWYRFRHLCIQRRISADESGWVAPLGHLRIKACLRLPGAYRSLPRPSSPVEAKSSIMSP